MNDVTIILKTFQRPDCLEKCVESIRNYYPDIVILIADDSKDAKMGTCYYNQIRYSLPFDSGLSYGRNFLLDKVKTKYVVVIDDDFEFIEETNLRKLKSLCSGYPDIVAGTIREQPINKIRRYEALLLINDNILTYIDTSKGLYKHGEYNYKIYELVMNFFMAKTNAIKKVRWDDDLKIVEHTDFFIRAKEKGLVCIHCPEVIVNHIKNNNARPDYDPYRHRYKEFYDMFLKKHNLKRVVKDW